MSFRTFPLDLFLDRPRDSATERPASPDVLDRMADERRAWLVRIRAALALLCLKRVGKWGQDDPRACVTGDDAHLLEAARPGLALPAGASRNTLGVVFRAPGWVHSEHPDHVSATPGSKGNLIYRWRYVGERRIGA